VCGHLKVPNVSESDMKRAWECCNKRPPQSAPSKALRTPNYCQEIGKPDGIGYEVMGSANGRGTLAEPLTTETAYGNMKCGISLLDGIFNQGIRRRDAASLAKARNWG